MKVYQIVCISSGSGLFKTDSFKTTAVSEGVSEDEIREIEKKVVFQHDPLNYENEDAHIQPIYSFFKLESGRYCVCMVKPLSEDDMVFFCHGLILDEGNWPFYPIQLWGSEAFLDSYETDEKEIYSLPVLNDIPVGTIVTYDSVCEFARKRLEHGVNSLINAAAASKECGMAISIYDDISNIPLWIGAVQMAFPVSIAHHITFSALPDFDGSCMIKGIFSRKQDYMEDAGGRIIFDFIRGYTSKMNLSLKFTRLVNTGYEISRTTLEKFHKFLEQFDYHEADKEIDSCYNLFLLSYLGTANMNSQDIGDAFKFAAKYGHQEVLEDIFQMTEHFMDNIARALDCYGLKEAAQFMFKTAANSKKLILMDKVYCFIYSAIDHIVMDFSINDPLEILKLYDEIKALSGERVSGFIKHSIGAERIGFLADVLSKECTAERAVFYLRIIMANLIELGYYWEQSVQICSMAVLVDTCITSVLSGNKYIDIVLEGASGGEDYLAKVVMLIYNRIQSSGVMESLLDCFIRVMDTKEEAYKLDVRKKLLGMEGGGLLFDEFKCRLDMAEDKPAFFNDYREHVFYLIPGFEKQYFSCSLKSYIEQLPHECIFTESLKYLWELIDGAIILEDDTVILLIREFEGGLSFKKLTDEEKRLVPEIKKIKKMKNIHISPDITRLIDFAMWLKQNNDEGASISEVLKEMPDIDRLDSKEYVEYINLCLPGLIALSKSSEDHKLIIRSFSREDADTSFYSLYFKSIEELLSIDKDKGFGILLQFEFCYFYYFEAKLRVLEHENTTYFIRALTVNLFLDQSYSFIKNFNKCIAEEFEQRGLSLPIQWSLIYNEVVEKIDKPFMEKITAFFRKR